VNSPVDFSLPERHNKRLKDDHEDLGPMFSGLLLQMMLAPEIRYRLVLSCPDVDDLTVLISIDDRESILTIGHTESRKEEGLLYMDLVMNKTIANHMVSVFPEGRVISCVFYTIPFHPDVTDDFDVLYEWVAGTFYKL
jgi:hypothetical protein